MGGSKVLDKTQDDDEAGSDNESCSSHERGMSVLDLWRKRETRVLQQQRASGTGIKPKSSNISSCTKYKATHSETKILSNERESPSPSGPEKPITHWMNDTNITEGANSSGPPSPAEDALETENSVYANAKETREKLKTLKNPSPLPYPFSQQRLDSISLQPGICLENETENGKLGNEKETIMVQSPRTLKKQEARNRRESILSVWTQREKAVASPSQMTRRSPASVTSNFFDPDPGDNQTATKAAEHHDCTSPTVCRHEDKNQPVSPQRRSLSVLDRWKKGMIHTDDFSSSEENSPTKIKRDDNTPYKEVNNIATIQDVSKTSISWESELKNTTPRGDQCLAASSLEEKTPHGLDIYQSQASNSQKLSCTSIAQNRERDVAIEDNTCTELMWQSTQPGQVVSKFSNASVLQDMAVSDSKKSDAHEVPSSADAVGMLAKVSTEGTHFTNERSEHNSSVRRNLDLTFSSLQRKEATASSISRNIGKIYGRQQFDKARALHTRVDNVQNDCGLVPKTSTVQVSEDTPCSYLNPKTGNDERNNSLPEKAPKSSRLMPIKKRPNPATPNQVPCKGTVNLIPYNRIVSSKEKVSSNKTAEECDNNRAAIQHSSRKVDLAASQLQRVPSGSVSASQASAILDAEAHVGSLSKPPQLSLSSEETLQFDYSQETILSSRSDLSPVPSSPSLPALVSSSLSNQADVQQKAVSYATEAVKLHHAYQRMGDKDRQGNQSDFEGINSVHLSSRNENLPVLSMNSSHFSLGSHASEDHGKVDHPSRVMPHFQPNSNDVEMPSQKDTFPVPKSTASDSIAEASFLEKNKLQRASEIQKDRLGEIELAVVCNSEVKMRGSGGEGIGQQHNERSLRKEKAHKPNIEAHTEEHNLVNCNALTTEKGQGKVRSSSRSTSMKGGRPSSQIQHSSNETNKTGSQAPAVHNISMKKEAGAQDNQNQRRSRETFYKKRNKLRAHRRRLETIAASSASDPAQLENGGVNKARCARSNYNSIPDKPGKEGNPINGGEKNSNASTHPATDEPQSQTSNTTHSASQAHESLTKQYNSGFDASCCMIPTSAPIQPIPVVPESDVVPVTEVNKANADEMAYGCSRSVTPVSGPAQSKQNTRAGNCENMGPLNLGENTVCQKKYHGTSHEIAMTIIENKRSSSETKPSHESAYFASDSFATGQPDEACASEAGNSDSLSFFSHAGSAFSGYSGRSSFISHTAARAGPPQASAKVGRGTNNQTQMNEQNLNRGSHAHLPLASNTYASSFSQRNATSQPPPMVPKGNRYYHRNGLASRYDTPSRFLDSEVERTFSAGAENSTVSSASAANSTCASEFSRSYDSGVSDSEIYTTIKGPQRMSSMKKGAVQDGLSQAFQDAYQKLSENVAGSAMLQQFTSGLNDGVQKASESFRKFVDHNAKPCEENSCEENACSPRERSTGMKKSRTNNSTVDEAIAIEVEYLSDSDGDDSEEFIPPSSANSALDQELMSRVQNAARRSSATIPPATSPPSGRRLQSRPSTAQCF